jgi:hypothetical protein
MTVQHLRGFSRTWLGSWKILMMTWYGMEWNATRGAGARELSSFYSSAATTRLHYDIFLMMMMTLLPRLLEYSRLFELGIGRDVLLILFDLELFGKFLDLTYHGGHPHIFCWLVLHGVIP